jgi:hypothetical protein
MTNFNNWHRGDKWEDEKYVEVQRSWTRDFLCGSQALYLWATAACLWVYLNLSRNHVFVFWSTTTRCFLTKQHFFFAKIQSVTVSNTMFWSEPWDRTHRFSVQFKHRFSAQFKVSDAFMKFQNRSMLYRPLWLERYGRLWIHIQIYVFTTANRLRPQYTTSLNCPRSPTLRRQTLGALLSGSSTSPQ